MSKRSSTKRPPVDPRDRRGIAITASFKGKCRTAIQRAVDADCVVFKEVASSRGLMVFCWAPTTGSRAFDAKVGEVPVSLLLRTPDGQRSIWIAPGFRLQSNDLVDSVTLRLYAGDFAAESKKLLIRAEWDLFSDEDSRKAGHAQPHWHFHVETETQPASLSEIAQELSKPRDIPAKPNTLSGLAAVLGGANELDTIERENGNTGNVRGEVPDEAVHGVHFPMAATWDSIPLACISEQTDERALYQWLEALTRYIRAEFQSLYGLPQQV